MTFTPTPEQYVTSEQVVRAMLTLIADHPGTVGPIRLARLVGGFPTPDMSDERRAMFEQYRIDGLDWPLLMLTTLIDVLASGELLAMSSGAQTLSLTRAGHRALTALEQAEAI